MTLYFFYAFIAAALLNFICSILILRGMSEAGVKVSFFEIRWQVHKHLKGYRKISIEKNGNVAWPYYAYKGSLAGLVGFAILTLFSLSQ
jgi:hypothetical protein